MKRTIRAEMFSQSDGFVNVTGDMGGEYETEIVTAPCDRMALLNTVLTAIRVDGNEEEKEIARMTTEAIIGRRRR